MTHAHDQIMSAKNSCVFYSYWNEDGRQRKVLWCADCSFCNL